DKAQESALSLTEAALGAKLSGMKALSILAALVSLCAGSSLAQGVGAATVLRQGSSVEERLSQTPLPLEEGDRVTTGRDEATVRLKDGSELRLAADSRAVIGKQTRREV